jgi:hypothetical protein
MPRCTRCDTSAPNRARRRDDCAGRKIVEQMGIANALRRRFARLDEIKAIWRPAAVDAAPAGAGVFAHLTPKGHGPRTTLELPAIIMTWDKFHRTILPEAEAMEFCPAWPGRLRLPHHGQRF